MQDNLYSTGDELEAPEVLNSPNVDFMFYYEKTLKIVWDLITFIKILFN